MPTEQRISKLGEWQADAPQRNKAEEAKSAGAEAWCAVDEERDRVQALLAELEHTIGQQSKGGEFERERLSTLQRGLEEAIAKLVLAAAAKAETCHAERAEVIQSELQDRLADEQALHRTQERKVLVLQEKLEHADAQVFEKNEQIAELRKQLSTEHAQVFEKTREIVKLQAQLMDEITRRQTVQDQVMEQQRMFMDLLRRFPEISKTNELDNMNPHEGQPVPTQVPHKIQARTVVWKPTPRVATAQASPQASPPVPTYRRVGGLSPQQSKTSRILKNPASPPLNTRRSLPAGFGGSHSQHASETSGPASAVRGVHCA